MTDVRVDPAAFRRHLFEAQWVKPLEAECRSQASRRRDRPQSSQPLAAALLSEAAAWIALGERCGYFAEWGRYPSAPDSVSHQYVRRKMTEAIDVSRRAEVDVVLYADALSQARLDLAPSRREFLRLVFFADEREWAARVSAVNELSGSLGRLSLPTDQLLDETAWCLAGADTSLTQRTGIALPSDWRGHFADMSESDYELANRVKEIEAIRNVLLEQVAVAIPLLDGERSVESQADQVSVASPDRSPALTRAQRSLAITRTHLGDRSLEDGHLEEAERQYRRAEALEQALVEANPTAAPFWRNLAITQGRLGQLDESRGDLGAAAAAYQSALDSYAQIAALDPSDRDAALSWALLHANLGDVLQQSADASSALAHYERARATLEALVGSESGDTTSMHNLSAILVRLGDVSQGQDSAAAAQYYIAATRVLRSLAEQNPSSGEVVESAVAAHQHIAEVMWRSGDREGAEAQLRAAENLLGTGE